MKQLAHWSLPLLATLETIREPCEQAPESVLEDERTRGRKVRTLCHNTLTSRDMRAVILDHLAYWPAVSRHMIESQRSHLNYLSPEQ